MLPIQKAVHGDMLLLPRVLARREAEHGWTGPLDELKAQHIDGVDDLLDLVPLEVHRPQLHMQDNLLRRLLQDLPLKPTAVLHHNHIGRRVIRNETHDKNDRAGDQ